MKKKFLKSYDSFKKEGINENFFGSFFADEERYPKLPEEIVDETSEELPEIENIPEEKPEETSYSYSNDISLTPKDFSIVKIMTDKGEKVAMCYTSDCSDYGSEILSNLDFKTAALKVEEIAKDEELSIYDSEKDEILGAVPTSLIPKKKKEITSYREVRESLEDVAVNKDEIKRKREEIFDKIDKLETQIDNMQNDTAISDDIKDVEIPKLEIQLESLKSKYGSLIKKK
jgi:hypothetical protein